MNLHVPFTQTQQLGRFCYVCFDSFFFFLLLCYSILKQIPDLQSFPSYILHIHLKKLWAFPHITKKL